MNDPKKEFRDRLLEMEQITPALKDKYQKETQAMFEKKLTVFGKFAWIGSGILGIVFVVLFGTVAIWAPKEFPVLGRMVFILGAVFGLAWAGLCASILKRGSFDRMSHSKAAAGMGWGITIIVMTWAMLFAGKHPDSLSGIRAICVGLAFLVMAAVFMITSRIQQSELRTREKLLEIELRMAELAETLGGKES